MSEAVQWRLWFRSKEGVESRDPHVKNLAEIPVPDTTGSIQRRHSVSVHSKAHTLHVHAQRLALSHDDGSGTNKAEVCADILCTLQGIQASNLCKYFIVTWKGCAYENDVIIHTMSKQVQGPNFNCARSQRLKINHVSTWNSERLGHSCKISQ